MVEVLAQEVGVVVEDADMSEDLIIVTALILLLLNMTISNHKQRFIVMMNGQPSIPIRSAWLKISNEEMAGSMVKPPLQAVPLINMVLQQQLLHLFLQCNNQYLLPPFQMLTV